MRDLRSDDPQRLGRYALSAVLGGGGMGRVYLGLSPGGHRVAVKVIRAEHADDSEFRRRFAIEVAAARKVSGLYTAQVLDADPDGDPPWMVTDYVQGLSLQEVVAKHGPLPAPTVRLLAAGLAEGLEQVHAALVVHRDLKPSNVILTEDGPKLLDFGIARALDATSYTRSQHFGTPGYMSPEQARAEPVDAASDVFSLGSTLVYAATGLGLFGDGNPFAMAARVARCDIDSATLDRVPNELRALLTACLHEEPQQRARPAEIIELAGTTAGRAQCWLPKRVARSIHQEVTERLPPVQPVSPTLKAPGKGRPGDRGKQRAEEVPEPPRGVPKGAEHDRAVQAPRDGLDLHFDSPATRPKEWARVPPGRVLGAVLLWVTAIAVLVFGLAIVRPWWSALVSESLAPLSGVVGFLLEVAIGVLLPLWAALAGAFKVFATGVDLVSSGRQFDVLAVDVDQLTVSRTGTSLPDVEVPWTSVKKIGLHETPDGYEIRVWLKRPVSGEVWAKQHDLAMVGSGAYVVSRLTGWHKDLSRDHVDRLHDALERCADKKYVPLTADGEPRVMLT